MISDSAQAGGGASPKLRAMGSDLAEPGSGKVHTFFTVTRKIRVWKTTGKDLQLFKIHLLVQTLGPLKGASLELFM